MATITIASTVFPNVNYTGTTFTWRIFSDKSWIAADGTIVPARGDSDTFYKEYAVSVAGTNGTVPQITLLSQTDALNEKNARYSIYWCVDGVLKDMVLANTLGAFQIPDTPASTTWGAVEQYNFGVSRRYYKDDGTYSALVIDQKIAAISASTTLATSTLAGLPTAGTAGRERLVTDTDEGVYVDSGTQWYSLTHGIFDFKRFGGVGDGSTSNTTILSSIITAIGSNQGTVIFPYSANPYVVGTVSVPSNVKLDFSAGGQIKVTTGATLAIASPKDDWPTRQLFTNATAGLGTVTFSGAGTVQASWFGDCITEVGTPLNAAIAAIRSVGGEVRLPNSASIQQTVSVNITNSGASTQNTITVSGYGRGTRIESKVTNGNSFDCTGTNSVTFKDFLLSGNASLTPKVGFLLARNSNGANNNAGFIHFDNVDTLGYFSVATIYNYASEDFRADNSHFINNAADRPTVMLLHSNLSSITSAYVNPMATGAISSTEARFKGTEIDSFGTGNADCLYIQGFDSVTFENGILVCNARSFVYIDASLYPCAVLNFEKVQFDGNATANYGFYVKGGSGVEVAYLTISSIYDLAGVKSPTTGGRSFYSETGATLNRLVLGTFYAVRGLYVSLDTAQYCNLDLGPGGTFASAGSAGSSITNSVLRVSSDPSFTMFARPDLSQPNTFLYYDKATVLAPIVPLTEGAALTISSNAIAPTNSIHQVGAGLIKTITVPSGFTSGTIALVPTAAFTYDATGNVLGTGTATIGRTMMATYSASTSKWSMSY